MNKFDFPIKLDIGCGRNRKKPDEEWVHLDFESINEHIEIVADFSNIPLPDKCVKEIYIGDVIEHIPLYNQLKVLCEWNRICQLDGKISGTTPNIDHVMRAYASGDPDMSLQEALKNLYGWGDRLGQIHYTTFTKETLTKLFAKCGFCVEDYSGSPGPVDKPWWLVFSGYKLSHVKLYELVAKGERICSL